ncbi:MAG: sugar phosphate isomerase/epimerase family protein [Fimbriimonadales bacterium]
MNLGLSMWSFVGAWKRGFEVWEFIHKTKEYGVDGVELLDFFFRDQSDWSGEAEKMQSALQETGLRCGVFSVANMFGDPANRSEQVAVINRGVDQANFFGAGVVRVFSGHGSDSLEKLMDESVTGLAEACGYAKSKGVKLALENHGLQIGRGDQVAEMIMRVREKTGDDTLGANPDTGNFLLCGNTSVQGTSAVAKYAYMCHFKDFTPAPAGFEGHAYEAVDGTKYVGTAIGEGSADLVGSLDALRAAGFSGWVNIEYEAEEDPFTGVPRSVAASRALVG